MSFDMTGGNIDVDALIERLQNILNFLDEQDLAIAAIKIEEAINSLKRLEPDASEVSQHDS